MLALLLLSLLPLPLFSLSLFPLPGPQATQVTPPPNAVGRLRPHPEVEILPVSAGLGHVTNETHVAFFVEEWAAGSGADLNGDGDQDDRIVAWYDRATGEITVSNIDGRFLAVGDGFVGVQRREADSGQDFNGDGQIAHDYAFVIDIPSGAATYLGYRTLQLLAAGGPHLAIRAWTPAFDINLLMYSHTSGTIVDSGFGTVGNVLADESGIAWIAPEEFGGPDLNNDGDLSDSVAVLLLADQSTFVSSETEATSLLAYEEGVLLFRTLELVMDRDLDEDGNQNDSGLFRFDAATGTREMLGVVNEPTLPLPVVSGGAIWYRGSEGFFGDLNGDQDLDDSIIVGQELLGTAQYNSGLAGHVQHRQGDRVLLFVDEFTEGDQNADGDDLDDVAAVWNLGTGTIVNLGSATDSLFEGGISPNGMVFMTANEFGNGIDKNNDGDSWDEYVEAYDATTGQAIPLDVPVGSHLVRNADYQHGIVARVYELNFGSDLSGDGDIGDAVSFLIEFSDLRVTNTGLATFNGGGSYIDGKEIFQVGFESNAQADLNGDGDSSDRVFIIATLP